MSLLLGNLRDLIGDLWDGPDDPEPEPVVGPDADVDVEQ
jgi:hypothetical protein